MTDGWPLSDFIVFEGGVNKEENSIDSSEWAYGRVMGWEGGCDENDDCPNLGISDGSELEVYQHQGNF